METRSIETKTLETVAQAVVILAAGTTISVNAPELVKMGKEVYQKIRK